MKAQILHYWLIANRGGEKVLSEIARLVQPDLCYTHLADAKVTSALKLGCEIRESIYASFPFARKAYKVLFPLMYLASYLLPLKDAQLIISSESGPIKGVRKRKDALHICYCHSPFRILWAPAKWYRPVLGKTWWLLPIFRWPLRLIDRLTARSVDVFVANSSFIQQRIKTAYGRESIVIHPPVEVNRFKPETDKGDYFLWLGELVSYKRPDLVLQAFQKNGMPLKVIGKGEMLERLKGSAGANIEFLEHVSDEELPGLIAKARALVFPGVEDFGIVFVEALASGTPVIAYRKGGILDIVRDGVSGLLFDEQSVEGVTLAVDEFIKIENQFDFEVVAQEAERFKPEVFRQKFRGVVNTELEKRGMTLV